MNFRCGKSSTETYLVLAERANSIGQRYYLTGLGSSVTWVDDERAEQFAKGCDIIYETFSLPESQS